MLLYLSKTAFICSSFVTSHSSIIFEFIDSATVVAFDKNAVFTYPGGMRDSGIEDATIVATHLVLAAADEGVNSCWINFFDPEKLAEALELPENEEVLMVMDLGYAAEGAGPLPNHTNRKRMEQTVSYM